MTALHAFELGIVAGVFFVHAFDRIWEWVCRRTQR